MSEKKSVTVLLEKLGQLAPMGYTVGLHIRFATPLVYKSSYPPAWVEHYNNNSYYLRDPLVFWGVGVEGTTRWSSIPLPDPFGVMKKAAGHGLNFGRYPLTARSPHARSSASAVPTGSSTTRNSHGSRNSRSSCISSQSRLPN
jgi:LuxR family transcriptional regulator, quorum-sensing system regulator SdiA